MRLLQGLIRRYLKRAESLDSAGSSVGSPRVFASPIREPAIFHPINRDGRRKAAPFPPPKRGRCNLSRNHFYRSVISSPKARTRLRPYRVVGVLVPLRFAFPESDKSEVALGKNVASALQRECRLWVPSRCNLLYLAEHISRYF